MKTCSRKRNAKVFARFLVLLMLLGGSTAYSAVPWTPTPIYPSYGSNVSGTTILFQWSQVPDATTYYIQVATDPFFNNLIVDWNIGNYIGMSLTNCPDNGQIYYWRVAAGNAEGWSWFSSTYYVTNGPSAIPPAPALISPANGATVIGTSITFQWGQSARAANYYLQVATDSGFSNVVFADWVGNYIGITLTGLPDNGQRYYWRVAAGNSLGSSYYSSAWSVINGPSAVPPTPALISPADGAMVNGTSITFQWGQSARAVNYYLQVATDSSFSNVVYADWVGNYIGITLTGLPDNGQRYYWRVAAGNSLGSSYYSSAWSVVNGPSSSPATPSLTSPPHDSYQEGTSITFQWAPAERAANYYLQIATDAGFSNVVFGEWIGYYIGINITGFSDDGKRYYWRVAAGNPLGSSLYSSAWSVVNGVNTANCASSVGSGYGVLTAKSHIDTCYYSSGPDYYLMDISRRNGGHHGGRMSNTSMIQTVNFNSGAMNDSDNNWNASGQATGVDAQVHAGWVYDYLNAQLGINSFDNAGSSMSSVVDVTHYNGGALCSDNAFWDGSSVRYCTGAPYAGALDVIAHEWGHAVTQTVAGGLNYEYESGALNEAFSDWMGTAVEHYYGETNWTIGEGINTIRDLSSPRLYGQPDTYEGTYWYPQTACVASYNNDWCGVHTNSGIPNKMFYLLSQGGSHNGVNVQGIGIQKAMEIAFKANKRWPVNVSFNGAKGGMVDAVNNDVLPYDPNLGFQVQNAWAAVGVGTLPVIGVSASPSEGGTISGGGSHEWGKSVRVTATAEPGYEFANWTESGSVVSSTATYSFVVNGGRTLVANFAATGPTGTISVNNGAASTNNTSVTLTISCNDTGSGCSQMQFSNDNASWSTAEAYATSKAWALSAGDGLKTVYVKFMDNAGIWSTAYSASIVLDTLAPAAPVINSFSFGTFQNSTTASLSGTAEASSTVKVYDNGNVTAVGTTAASGTGNWNLNIDSLSEGGHSFTAKATDAAGNTGIASSVAVLTIDMAAPTTTASPAGGMYNSARTVTLTCSDGTGSGCDKIYYTTDGSTPTTASTVYTTALSISTTTTLKFFAKDLAGNSETVKSQTYTIDATTPTGTIVINGNAASTNNPSITLTLTCNDSGSGCSQMQFSNDNTNWSAAEAYVTSKAWTMATGDGTKTVYAKFKDAAGNWSTAYNDTIVLDTTVPTTTVSQVGGTYNSAQTVTLTCSDGTGSGCDKIYYTTDGSMPTTASTVYTTALSISTTTTLKYFAKDMVGNSETVQSHVYLINVPPDISALPSSLSFATLACGNTSSAQTITVSNSASATALLSISSVSVSGNEYLIQSNNCTGAMLAASESCSVQVAFKPTYKWERRANLAIASSDPDTPTLYVPLTGTGGDTCPLDPSILLPILKMLLE